MNYPVAVAPSVKTPGVYLLVNLLAGDSSPGTGPLRALLIGPKTSSGTLATNTLRTDIGSMEEILTLTGNAPVAVMAEAIFAEQGIAAIDLICPPDPAGTAATGTLTFAGTPTTSWGYVLKIAGREYQGTWAAGTTHIVMADDLRLLISAKTKELPVSATDDNAGVLTIAFKNTGTCGNDVIVEFEITGGAVGTVDAGVVKVTKNLTGGLGNYDPAAALLAVAGTEYQYITPVAGNTDNNTSGGSTIAGKIQTHIDGLDAGSNAKLQQQIIAITSTHAAALAAAGYRNHMASELMLFQGARSLPWEVAAAECGARLREVALDPAVNRIGLPYRATLYGPIDPVASALTEPQVESALNGGVTPISQSRTGVKAPTRPITTYHLDSSSNPDDRVLDVSRVDGTYAVARDAKILMAQRFPQKKLVPDVPAGTDPPGGSSVQPKHVRTAIVQRVSQYWGETRQVVLQSSFDAAVENGQFICAINATDSAQLDLVIPFKIVPPLAKVGIVVNHVGP